MHPFGLEVDIYFVHGGEWFGALHFGAQKTLIS